ncbi:CFF_collapsed_G0035360.mRNA.1.CDS.1 [Saccharomyces cerevisiae]|nr:CFF_collapsed_G0035360.mRNA.1.CDS.1 [Saccharomyces cerevisiae]
MVGKNVQKFLTFVEDEPDFQGQPIPSKYLIPKKINLMVYTLFQVHTLKFNRKGLRYPFSFAPQQRIL